MHLQLRDQLKTILYICRLLYQILMIIPEQKSAIHTHTNKKKQFKHNTKNRHQTTRKENEKGKNPNKTRQRWPLEEISVGWENRDACPPIRQRVDSISGLRGLRRET